MSLTIAEGGLIRRDEASAITTTTITTTTVTFQDIGNEPTQTFTMPPSTTRIKIAEASSTATCTTNIDGGVYAVPHLLIPVSPLTPDTAYDTVFSPIMAPAPALNSTVFQYDVPSSYSGTCALVFLFPYANQAVFPYTFTGIEEEVGENGGINFKRLNGGVNRTTTYNTLPPVAVDYGKVQVIPGNNYTVTTLPCPGGQLFTVEASSVGGVGLQYFQNDQSVAIGLYLVPCA